MSIAIGDWKISTLTDLEFEKPCENGINCPHRAEWMCWAKHGGACKEVSVFSCTPCKEVCERQYIQGLKMHAQCTCGWTPVGNLSDFFRAIRL